MILELYSQTVRFAARAILLSASFVAMLIFVIDVALLFSNKVEHAPPIKFIVGPIMGFCSYFVSRFFVPTKKETITNDLDNVTDKKNIDEPSKPSGLTKLTDKQFANIVADTLIMAGIVKKEDFDRSVEVIVEEIEVRKAIGDYFD